MQNHLSSCPLFRPKTWAKLGQNRGKAPLFAGNKKALQPLKLQGFYLERMMGIEPTTSAWEAEVLPLNYIRKYYSAAFPVF